MQDNLITNDVTEAVQGFYADLPFNYHGSTESAAEQILHNSVQMNYPDLHELLLGDEVRSVYEFGCGAGWLSNTVACHYERNVKAFDFTAKAIERAQEVAKEVETADNTEFVYQNFLELDSLPTRDLSISLGVLHHTANTQKSFQHLCKVSDPGKYFYLGLYHLHGREEFLQMFHDIVASDGEEAAFRQYAELTRSRPQDETYTRSWFRDQVLHPHETQHTLEEVASWMDDAGFDVVSTSINRFEAFDDITPLFEQEKEYAEISRRANREEGRYFPGFFTVLGKRRGA